MDIEDRTAALLKELQDTSECTAQQFLLDASSAEVMDLLVPKLKEHVDWLLRTTDGIPRAFQFVELIFHLAKLTNDDRHWALGMRAKGNIHANALYEPEPAIDCYTQAAEIYRHLDDRLEEAHAQVGLVGALARLGNYDKAERIFQQIHIVFQEYRQWIPLGKVTANLAVVYSRQGDDAKALEKANQARVLFCKVGSERERFLPIVDNNLALSLQNLGRFEESIKASQDSWAINTKLGQTAEAVRARQATAFTYFLQGQYNKALQIYDEVRKAFIDGDRKRDALVADLENSYCLLQLCRFNNVLEICHEIQTQFATLQAPYESSQSFLNQATAYASKRKPEYDKVLNAALRARSIFESQNSPVWIARTDLQIATIFSLQGQYIASLETAQTCAEIFRDHELPVYEAHGWLVAARAALALEWHGLAARLCEDSSMLIKEHEVLFLAYQINHLRSRLALSEKNYRLALDEYKRAIDDIEMLRGRVMIEFSAGFLEDKQLIYEEVVQLCLEKLDDVKLSWHFAERAKSRALIDLLAYRMDLRIQSRSSEDDALVQEVTELRAERNRLYRRWQVSQREHIQSVDLVKDAAKGSHQYERQISELEQTIERKWHELLKRNADYERDSAMSIVSLERVQFHLESDTALLEYFVVGDQLYLFWITTGSIQKTKLGNFRSVRRLLKALQLNLSVVPKSQLDQIKLLTRQAQGILQQLYQLLIEPIESRLDGYSELVLVPHSELHTLPFHALFDGDKYLMERYGVSYLPSASLLHYCRRFKPSGTGTLIVAHTQGQLLPAREREGRFVEKVTSGTILLNKSATVAEFYKQATGKRIVHLATHGEFRADNPLFSGLALEDGELTTLDIFNLQLNASLVTLSACETAGFKLGGGDELIGLSRAFFSAGAASLVVSHWRVEDEATAALMEAFYRELMQKRTKSHALSEAQKQFIHGQLAVNTENTAVYAHPFFGQHFS
ncbi:CHAT domain-containing protein [Chloroflexi bacterium TSY]|nr:CHAT domain-containing protein [Chloroflexi bacterium TSY]